MKTINCSRIRKILVTRIDRMGDVVLSTPVFRAIKERYPAMHVCAMVAPETRDLVTGNPSIDSIFVYDRRRAQKSFVASLAFAHRLRREHIDAAVHLYPCNRMHILSCVAGIPVRIGYRRNMAMLLTHMIPEYKWQGLKHESEYNFDLLVPLDVPVPRVMSPFVAIGDEDQHKLDVVLQQLPPLGKRFVVVLPSASCHSKLWPMEYFIDVGKRLRDQYGVTIAAIGAPPDAHYAEDLCRGIGAGAVNVSGILSLKMMGALMQRSRLFISNDSGPVHVAASLHVPLIVIFGRNEPGLGPSRWRPLSDNSVVIQKDVGCTLCGAHLCDKHFICLRAVTPDDVIRVVDERFAQELMRTSSFGSTHGC